MNGSATFRLERSNFIVGLVCAAGTVVFAILTLFIDPPNSGVWLSLMIPCLFFSLLALIPCMAMRVRIDDRGIEYRSVRKTYIRWQDAEHIYIIYKRRSAVIYGSGKRIAVGTMFGGFSRMLRLIEQYAQVEIGDDAALKQKEIDDAMGKTFRKSKFLAIFGFFMLALALILILSDYNPGNPIEKPLGTIVGAGLGIYFIQAYYLDKLYVDSQRIVRSSLFHGRVEIRWHDIESVFVRYRRKMQTFTIISNDNGEITFTSEFKQFDDIAQFIRKFSPVEPVDADDN